MRSTARHLLTLGALAVVLPASTMSAAAATVGSAARAGHHDSVATGRDRPQPLKIRDLLRAPVPASCRHKAGRLVAGHLPLRHPKGGADPGFATVLRSHGSHFLVKPVLADLTHDGKSELSGVLLCSAGGVTWPELVMVYERGPKLLGFVNLGDVTKAEHSDVTSMSAKHGDLRLTWKSYDGCCFQVHKHSATVHWTGSKLVMRNVK
ncbi:hypothetical protein J5X84_08535 [Streptosporangiaceae bacterium NEAU-GS5]|nr:hypothetical protein [Streptosporangiaceae bacterium NEAU-GS5]